MIKDFGGAESKEGNTGPFWVGSGMSCFIRVYCYPVLITCCLSALAVISALVTFFFIRPLNHDGMEAEDRAVRHLYPFLRINGPETKMPFSSVSISRPMASMFLRWVFGRVMMICLLWTVKRTRVRASLMRRLLSEVSICDSALCDDYDCNDRLLPHRRIAPAISATLPGL